MLHVKRLEDDSQRYFVMEQLGLPISGLTGSAEMWDGGEDE